MRMNFMQRATSCRMLSGVDAFIRSGQVRSASMWLPAVSKQAGPEARTVKDIQQPFIKKDDDIDDETLKQPDYFGVRKLYTVRDLFEARVHLGHAVGTLDDRMRQFVFGKRFDQLVIDLDQTAEYLAAALNFTAHVAYRKGMILFICRNRTNGLGHMVEQAAIDSGEYAHTRYWAGGMLTNAPAIFRAVTRLPDLVIFINTLNTVLEPHIGQSQAAKMNIPTVGIVDTNCNPNMITYPVPGNDDSPASIAFYCKLFTEAILLGKKKRAEKPP